jgi:hypothetical protein
MIIYGTAILAICHLLATILATPLGMLLGVKAKWWRCYFNDSLNFV